MTKTKPDESWKKDFPKYLTNPKFKKYADEMDKEAFKEK
jgi:hypothetical protein